MSEAVKVLDHGFAPGLAYLTYPDEAGVSLDRWAAAHRPASGRLPPADVLRILDQVLVDYYGQMLPISQVANVSLLDARTISVQPWEKGLGPKIEKAIRDSDLGLNPSSLGELIRVPLPAMTEERRKELTKVARHEAEKAFGNAAVYIEKFIVNPHHIEFQIIGDEHGQVVHLGERAVHPRAGRPGALVGVQLDAVEHLLAGRGVDMRINLVNGASRHQAHQLLFGGIGNLAGAMLGGILLGIIEALGAGYIGDLTGGFLGSHYQDIFAFVVLILVLTVRPSGIMGERVADRA